MKHTTPDSLLSRDLLCFVRDQHPTVGEFVARFGGAGGQAFHVLRKYAVIVVAGGRVRLSRRHLAPHDRLFSWGCRLFLLDRDEVLVVRSGPGGPPAFAPAP